MPKFPRNVVNALTLAALCSVAATASSSTEMLQNGGFETGDLSGWLASTSSVPPGSVRSACCDNRFALGSGVSTTGGSLGRIAGNYSIFGDFDGGVTTNGQPDYNAATDLYLSQTFTKSGVFSTAVLSFQFQVAYGQFSSFYVSNPLYGGTIFPRTLDVRLSQGGTAAVVYSYSVPDGSLGLHPLQSVNVNVASALNAFSDGAVTLTIERHTPQYYTGQGYFVADNFSIVAAPIPEPESYAMLLAGLGLLGGVARSRKQK